MPHAISCCARHSKSVREDLAFTAFERLFHDRGLPVGIRSDNGVPFASPNALFNLSRLSVWWLRLGIQIERIRPGRPQQNGRHERMHLTLKKEATRPPGMNSLQQQARFDDFLLEFNDQRPHEALGMKCPAQLYAPSQRQYIGLPEVNYPFHDRTVLVTACGRICLHRKKINLSTVFAGHTLGIKEVDEGIWLVSFMDYDLGYFDLEQKTLQPLDNRFPLHQAESSMRRCENGPMTSPPSLSPLQDDPHRRRAIEPSTLSSVVSGDLSINRDNVGRVLHLPVSSVGKIGDLLKHCLVGFIANAYGVNLDPRGILL